MSAIDQVIQSQDRILQKLALCEKTIGELYERYGNCHPDMADFWRNLATEEQTHGDLLEQVRADLKEGELMRGLGHFKEQTIQDRIRFVREKITEAQQEPPSKERAVAIALSIESSIIDSRFFEFAKSNGSEFQKAAHQLIHDTREHVKLVQEAKLALGQSPD